MNMIKETIEKNLRKTIKKLYRLDLKVSLSPPSTRQFGDYTTNIAMRMAKSLKKNPFIVAQEIAKNLPPIKFIEKIETLKPGFINFWSAKKYLTQALQGEKIEIHNSPFQGKKIMVEYTDPNLFKEFHIGHLYSNIVGESLARIFSFLGATVKRANYQGDVGMHVAKFIWGIKKKMKDKKMTIKDIAKFNLAEKAKLMGQAYTLGTQQYQDNPQAKKEIVAINQQVYRLDPKIKELYKITRQWALDYFEAIYKRLGTAFDFYYFESKTAKPGLKYVQDNIKPGIFKKSQGAIVFAGEKYGLHTRVFINSLGLPTYEAKDLGLAVTKYQDFPYDQSIIVVGNEVKDYFKVVLKALELINPSLRRRTVNIFTGMVNLPQGKMSSRLGNIVTAEWLLDEANKKSWQKIQETTKTKIKKDTAEIIGQGAVKYALLKNNLGSNIKFDFNESINFNGNSGPYIQYTYVRCQSVIKKSKELLPKKGNYQKLKPQNKEEDSLIRLVYHFPEIVNRAAKTYSPHLIANFLFNLCQEYNLFYQKHLILKAEEKTRELRLLITKAVAKTIKQGLYLLGIKTVDRM